MVVVETLLVNVVNSVPMRTRINTITDGGSDSNTPSELPITFDSPDACIIIIIIIIITITAHHARKQLVHNRQTCLQILSILLS